MIAHAPKPATARPMPTTAPATVAAIDRTSSARKSIDRVSSAVGTVPSDAIAKPSERTITSPRTAGSW
jgi:hypothetical protein